MKRKIVVDGQCIELAKGVLDSYCWTCGFDIGGVCEIFKIPMATAINTMRRLPECVAAEKEAKG